MVVVLSEESGFCKILEMKGESAASKALGHSSCGRCPHPDIVISLCKHALPFVNNLVNIDSFK